MDVKMNRRTFLKTTAAAAAVVSVSGLLGGCGSPDKGTDLGGFTATIGKWEAIPHEGIGTGLSRYADFSVEVGVHNLDASNPINLPGRAAFILKIDGEKITLQPGGLLSNTTLSLKKGEYRTDKLTFRLTEDQMDLYTAMKNKEAEIRLTVGIDPTESYTGSYDTYTFVKDGTV